MYIIISVLQKESLFLVGAKLINYGLNFAVPKYSSASEREPYFPVLFLVGARLFKYVSLL